ncbi:MAG: replicative DNA helicase [Nitrososphaera sp.]|nr:replicative DNA helicase [Nitrososphaera sp.]
MITPKIPPSDRDAERATLGVAILDPNNRDVVSKLVNKLKPEDFYDNKHRVIFRAIGKMFVDEKPIDLITLCAHLKDSDEIGLAGGGAYVSSLLDDMPMVAMVPEYADRVSALSKVRTISDLSAKLYAKSVEPGAGADELLDLAFNALHSVSDSSKSSGIKDAASLVSEQIEKIGSSVPSSLSAIRTGYTNLDMLTGGLFPGEVTVIAARPGIGKTALAMNIGINAARDGVPVIVYSLEMSSESLIQRMMCSMTSVNALDLRRNALYDDDKKRLYGAWDYFKNLPMWINDNPRLSPPQIAADVRDAMRKHKTDRSLVVIDYLQLMQDSAFERNDPTNRQQEVTRLSRGLKLAAKSLRVPFIVLSQLNRSVESREEQKPRLSDIRESGSVEQDADNVLFLYKDDTSFINDDCDMVHCSLAKQRSGPTGDFDLKYMKPYTRFDDPSKGEPPVPVETTKETVNAAV